MAPVASRNTILRLINAAQYSACPCHSCSTTTPNAHGQLQALSQMRKYATPVNSVQKEYAFEARSVVIYLFCSNVRRTIGCSVQLEIWRWRDGGSGYGLQEYESTQGDSFDFLQNNLPTHSATSRSAFSRILTCLNLLQ